MGKGNIREWKSLRARLDKRWLIDRYNNIYLMSLSKIPIKIVISISNLPSIWRMRKGWYQPRRQKQIKKMCHQIMFQQTKLKACKVCVFIHNHQKTIFTLPNVIDPLIFQPMFFTKFQSPTLFWNTRVIWKTNISIKHPPINGRAYHVTTAQL